MKNEQNCEIFQAKNGKYKKKLKKNSIAFQFNRFKLQLLTQRCKLLFDRVVNLMNKKMQRYNFEFKLIDLIKKKRREEMI